MNRLIKTLEQWTLEYNMQIFLYWTNILATMIWNNPTHPKSASIPGKKSGENQSTWQKK